MARYFKSKDAAVITRRQKDLENYTEYFAKQLDKVVGQHILELEPAWRNMKDRANKAWHEAFREYRAAKGTDREASLSAPTMLGWRHVLLLKMSMACQYQALR